MISQDALDSFRSAVEAQSSDPTTFLMKRNKLPMSLIETPGQIPGLKQHAAKIAVGSQPFSETFGPKAQRKRPKLDFSSIEDLAGRTGSMHETYVERLENAKLLSGTSGEAEQNESFADNPNGELTSAREFIFMKGTSKRIWNELYKVSNMYHLSQALSNGQSRSLIPPMSFSMSSTPATLMAPVAAPSKNTFAPRHLTSIWFLSSTRSISFPPRSL